MGERYRHPRALVVFRVGLSLVVGGALTLLAVTVVSYLGLLALVGGLVAVVGGRVDVLAGVAFGVLGVVGVGAVGAGIVVGARRLERRVRRADAKPDPLDVVTERYVRADIDERELERGVERVLVERERARR